MKKGKESLKFIILSDIHQSDLYIQKVLKWHAERKSTTDLEFDYVLIPGDTGTIPYKNGQTNELEQSKSKDKMVEILKKLQYFGCPILYIPGNHDCQVQFQGTKLTQKSQNIHKKSFQLTQNLRIKGFGGSVPGYSDNKVFWQGYPYQHQTQFNADFSSIFSEKETQQFILMSHIGPKQSTTTIDSAYEIVITGSETLDKYIEDNKDKLLLNVHGHTHEGTGTARYKSVTILNPGSVSRGNFCVLNLRWKQKWGVEKIQLIDMKYI